jgi:hypothetical protein
MYHKVKNTLASLAVAVSMLGVSYSIGRPPIESTAQVDFKSPGIEAHLDELQTIRSMQNQLSMPFFSFAPLLPRRES